MTAKLADETIVAAVGEEKNIVFEFTADLGTTGRALTGVPVVTDEGATGHLSFSNQATSGTQASVKVSGQQSGNQYTLKCSVGDDGSPAQTLIGRGRYNCP